MPVVIRVTFYFFIRTFSVFLGSITGPRFFIFSQKGITMALPIWKDYTVDLGAPAVSGGGVTFSIYSVAQTATIYEGVAYVRPGDSTAKARINDICADYIARYFLEQEDPSMPAIAEFKVYAGATLKADVEFYNDWSYDPQYNPSSDGQNFPIVFTFGPRQLIPVTLYPGGTLGTATITMASGVQYSCTPTKMRGGDFNNDFNLDFLVTMQYFGDSYVIPMADYPGAVKVEYKGMTWIASDKCPRYALYYANVYGGWDALTIEGKTVESDDITRHNTNLIYDNSQPAARGERTIINELSKTYDFYTGWLNEAQSGKMHNLLNSPSVYMHDLERDLIYPLTLTGTTTEHKDGGGKLFNYKISAKLAQERIRR